MGWMEIDKVKALLERGDGKYLCLEKRRGWCYYDFPGGSMESFDESPENALFRELDEELGILSNLNQVNKVSSIPYYKSIDTNKVRSIHPFYLSVKPGFEPELSGEHVGYKWLGEEAIRGATEDETLTNYRHVFFEYTRRFRDKPPSENPPVFNEKRFSDSIEDLLDRVE